jgi:hypothetical protein
MRRSYQTAMVLAAVTLICGIRPRAQEPEQTPRAGHPLWQDDVQQFGYERFPRKTVRPLRLVVNFVDNDHVAIAWVTPDTAPENKRKTPRVGETARLHAVILDAKTGLKQSQRDWSTPYYPVPQLFGLPDGRVLICSDNSLRLLSASLDSAREQELPNHGTCVNLSLQLSPSKHTLLLSIRAEQSRRLELLNVGDLATISTWTEGQMLAGAVPKGTLAISDDSLVGYCGDPPEICIRRFNEEQWHPLRVNGMGTQMSKGQRLPASFVSNDVLAIGSTVTTMATVRGELLSEIKLHEGHYLLTPQPSAAGEVFAVMEERSRGLRSEPLDMYPFGSDDRALVYSVKDRRAIFSLKLKGTFPWMPWNIHEHLLAVSPDGRSVAVLSDSLLTVYTLPKDSMSQP